MMSGNVGHLNLHRRQRTRRRISRTHGCPTVSLNDWRCHPSPCWASPFSFLYSLPPSYNPATSFS